MREGARFLETQEPSNVSDRKASVIQITFSEISPHWAKVTPFAASRRDNVRELTPKSSGDLADARLAVRKERQDRVPS